MPAALQVLQVLEDADSATRMHRRIPCEERNPQPEKTFTGLALAHTTEDQRDEHPPTPASENLRSSPENGPS